MFATEDRNGSSHRIRIDRISAYYTFQPPSHSEWVLSVILFGANTPYQIEFDDYNSAVSAFDKLNKHFECE